MFVVALVAVAAVWELYRLVGPDDGGVLFETRIVPRANATTMPHVWDMLARYTDAERNGGSRAIWRVVLAGCWFSFRLVAFGFALGAACGLGLAVLMARFRVAERALMPYLVMSQTVPLIALAPLVATWGGRVQISGWVWPRWLSAAVLGAFLSFFPIAIGALRGFAAAPEAPRELMRSYAASWGQTFRKLQFPAAVPQLVPALRLAAAGSVIGVIVSEISIGLKGGVGRLIIEYARQRTSDPEKLFTAIFGAAALGLVMAAFVTLVDVVLMRGRPREEVDEALP